MKLGKTKTKKERNEIFKANMKFEAEDMSLVLQN
jgi:hypothetical protein